MFFDTILLDLPLASGIMKPHTGKFIICPCEQEFYIARNRFETAKYCSRKCKNKFGCTVKIKNNCLICGKIFEHISSRCNKAKYCSRLCYHRSQKGKGTKEYTCKNCNIKFYSSPSKNHIFCSKKCTSIAKRIKSENIKYPASLRKLYERRGWIKKCEICGFNEFPEILGLHHKDRNRKNNKKDNILIVCPNCHSIIHKKHIPH